MRLNKFTYTDKSLDWSLDEISFDQLTLLIGASGVGKTLILDAILALKQISNGSSLRGVKWNVDFETAAGQNFIWEGEFENKGHQRFFDEDEDTKKKPKIVKEKLTLNGKILVERTSGKTIFQGKELIKLPSRQSVVDILREEDLIKPAYDGFQKIIFSDPAESKHLLGYNIFDANTLALEYNTLKKIQESDEEYEVKLYLVSKADPTTFNKIKDRFREIFPLVQDLKIEPLDFNGQNMPDIFKDYPVLQMQETGVSKWIKQEQISSGMFNTLIHISEIYLCQEGTVFLIDEFENSLGINCMDELTNDILKSDRQIQFIITSHHPYIINNIDFSSCKLVTKKSGVVRTNPINKFISGISKHDTFMQLIQLKQFETGTE